MPAWEPVACRWKQLIRKYTWTEMPLVSEKGYARGESVLSWGRRRACQQRLTGTNSTPGDLEAQLQNK